MDKKAKIYTYSVINTAAEAFADKVPYIVAILEDEEGHRFASFIEGYLPGMEIKIGREVEYSKEDPQGKAIYKF